MTVLAVAAVLAGAALASATGFGFALVAAPVLVTALDADEAIGAAVLLSIEVNAMTLLGERHAPSVIAGEAVRLVAWALPGLVAGALVLGAVSDRAIAVLVAVGVLVGLAARLRSRRGTAPLTPHVGQSCNTRGQAPLVARPAWSRVTAGLAAGALTTSTSLNGPPLVMYLTGTRATPAQVRETLCAVFCALGALGLLALLVAGTLSLPSELPLLAIAAAAGQLAGRRLFAFLDGERYEPAITGVLAATAVVAAVTAFT